jgi:predicted nuclease with TOPRIM domain
MIENKVYPIKIIEQLEMIEKEKMDEFKMNKVDGLIFINSELQKENENFKTKIHFQKKVIERLEKEKNIWKDEVDFLENKILNLNIEFTKLEDEMGNEILKLKKKVAEKVLLKEGEKLFKSLSK